MSTLSSRVKTAIREVPNFPIQGVSFKDITSLLLDASLSKEVSDRFIEEARKLNIDALCAIDSRGFIYGTSIAQALDIPMILIRKKGKLPGTTIAHSYDLEYGSATIEMHADDLPKGSRVLIHDDLLATGGTAAATAQLIEAAGSEVAGFSFIINLSFLPGHEKISSYASEIFSLVEY
jgi:adenine phosphoribosyltransferase